MARVGGKDDRLADLGDAVIHGGNHRDHGRKVYAHGELLVTGKNETVIETPLRRSRALFIHSTEAISVEFRDPPPPPPPCSNPVPDELSWDLYEHDWNKHTHGRDLFLKIRWDVQSPRHVVWRVFDVE